MFLSSDLYSFAKLQLFSFTDFKANFSAEPIRAADIYNVMCHTLGIEALPNNGSFDRVRAMLNRSSSITQQSCALVWLGLFSLFIHLHV